MALASPMHTRVKREQIGGWKGWFCRLCLLGCQGFNFSRDAELIANGIHHHDIPTPSCPPAFLICPTFLPFPIFFFSFFLPSHSFSVSSSFPPPEILCFCSFHKSMFTLQWKALTFCPLFHRKTIPFPSSTYLNYRTCKVHC